METKSIVFNYKTHSKKAVEKKEKNKKKMNYLEKMKMAETLIESGAIGAAKLLLLEALNGCQSQAGIDRILKKPMLY